ncbi:MAG: hypothetical protein DGJ47_000384 [Rickettsiaceae bacterium]
MSKKYNIAVVGATGNVGREVLASLIERNFPVGEIKAYASDESVGKSVSFGDDEIKCDVLKDANFSNIDMAFFCAGSAISQKYAEKAISEGCIVIDKSSFFRLAEDVPLVVPEVNPNALDGFQNGVVSSPNCCSIPLAVALKPLDNAAKIKRVVISTYQSVSGAGKEAMDELYNQTKSKFVFGAAEPKALPKQIAFNLFPHIGDFLEDGSSDEEYKIQHELKKIMGSHVQVSVTCVRVPVFVSHSMSVNVEFETPLTVNEAEEILQEEEGVVVYNKGNENQYTTPIEVVENDAVFVSRVREDKSQKNTLNLWVCCDNLRKGAALNAVQIAENIISDK